MESADPEDPYILLTMCNQETRTKSGDVLCKDTTSGGTTDNPSPIVLKSEQFSRISSKKWFEAIVPLGHRGSGYSTDEGHIFLYAKDLITAYNILLRKTSSWKKHRAQSVFELRPVESEERIQQIEALILGESNLSIEQVKARGFFYETRLKRK